MSYCRLDNDSDVYLYQSVKDGEYVYCFVLQYDKFAKNGFDLGQMFYVKDIPSALECLKDLSRAGYRFPDDAVKRLVHELESNP